MKYIGYLDFRFGCDGDAIHVNFVEVFNGMVFARFEKIKCIGMRVSMQVQEGFVVLKNLYWWSLQIFVFSF